MEKEKNGKRIDLPGKPWFDVLAHICRNSDTTLITENMKQFDKIFCRISLGRQGGLDFNDVIIKIWKNEDYFTFILFCKKFESAIII